MTKALGSTPLPGGRQGGRAARRFPSSRLAPCIAALALAACANTPDVEVDAGPTAPSWTRDASLEQRTAAVVDSAARVWGGLGGNVFSVTFTDATITCAASPGPVDGCETNGAIQVSILRSPCPEATSLAHEVGHAILLGADGDPGHTDRRWCDSAFWDSMSMALLSLVPRDDEKCRRWVEERGLYEAAGRPYCMARASATASP